MVITDYNIHLNFLPVEGALPQCLVYRRRCASGQEQRPEPRASAHRLPASPTDPGDWPRYWVLLNPAEGFEPFSFQPERNADLARRLLFDGLERSVRSLLGSQEYRFPTNTFVQEAQLVMARHPEGEELLVVHPYVLRAARRVGFLVDFHFRVGEGVQYSRRVQQLSLSLDSRFRRNLDYCVDRSSKIRRFVDKSWPIFESILLAGADTPLRVSRDFTAVRAERLRSKVYVFASGKESRSQFMGLREFGPLRGLEESPTLLFVFRERDREAARLLARSVRGLGRRGSYNFPGFHALFKTDVAIDPNPVILPDLSPHSMEHALGRAMSCRRSEGPVLPVVVLPNTEDNGYFAHKAYFTNAGLPTQVCTLRVLQDEESLRWAVANLALQMFCKAGGWPWKVRPAAEHSLIIGISQSHKTKVVDGARRVERYFAFSVLSESSGLFREIQVLGDSPDRPAYIEGLRSNLSRVLRSNSSSFNRLVIHTSFRLRYEEIDAIRKAAGDVARSADGSNCRFAVVKVNHRNRFFGANRGVNSLVPFEATKVRLGPQEYLVWFEGIFPDKPNVTKAFPGPTHLQFLPVGDDPPRPAEEREMLQDLVNLSGANWRGFNAKSAPVSVFYCHLVADLVRDFHERGLPLPAVHDIRPWFL